MMEVLGYHWSDWVILVSSLIWFGRLFDQILIDSDGLMLSSLLWLILLFRRQAREETQRAPHSLKVSLGRTHEWNYFFVSSHREAA